MKTGGTLWKTNFEKKTESLNIADFIRFIYQQLLLITGLGDKIKCHQEWAPFIFVKNCVYKDFCQFYHTGVLFGFPFQKTYKMWQKRHVKKGDNI